MTLLEKYNLTRQHTESICSPLQTEDYVVQPVADVSPPKWHIGHTTWFFETFILKDHLEGYQEFNPDYNYVFNSYYETVGKRVVRTDRGNLSRPTVSDIYNYRKHVDEAMRSLLLAGNSDVTELVVLGINHEQQHQELLYTDIKFILGHNPLLPAYSHESPEYAIAETSDPFLPISKGLYEVGYAGDDFCFDNELNRHKVYVDDYSISPALVTNGDFIAFINAAGYTQFRYWHAEGWDWVNTNGVRSPLYWHQVNGEWHRYTLAGLQRVDPAEAVTHVSFYEASAYAAWKGLRLPTEFEWEIAALGFSWGLRWEWTESAYLPYPGFTRAEGAIGEYNGKFMVNQKVLRGASIFTPTGHSRITYRNFFHPHLRWQATGIRLAQ